VALKEIVLGDNVDQIFMVMEYLEHDMKMLMRVMKQPFRQAEVKCLLKQLLSAVDAMHDRWVLHRDLKTSNLLYNNHGTLKVCDFGLARRYDDPIGDYTQLVVTLWYRAPELLLGAKTYTPAIDMWSVGCIFAEFLSAKPLLAGNGEFDQLDKMFKLLGTPNEKIWPGYSELPHAQTYQWKKQPHNRLRSKFPKQSYTTENYLSDLGLDLLQRMLCYDPKQRITAKEALAHPYFEEAPRTQDPSMMPTFPSVNEGNRKKLKDKNSVDLRLERDRVQEGFFVG